MRKIVRPRLEVLTRPSEQTIDVLTWADRYVAHVLALEGFGVNRPDTRTLLPEAS